jgi:hypothetical protein
MGLGIGISGPNGSEPCDDANVVNSDGTYDVDVAAGGTLNLPDINNVDSDGSVVATPAQTPFVATACGPGGSVGATLMKTNQTISYRTGDDGDLEKGRATDFLTLASANPFNTLERFTDELGGQTYTNKIFIDWSTYDGTTVLGYGDATFLTYNWNDAIDTALSWSVGSFTSGWRLPNINEMFNIFNQGVTGNKLIAYFPFTLQTGGGQSSIFWSSTRLGFSTSNAYYAQNFTGGIRYTSLTNTYNICPVRDFTVSGTTLT